LETLPFVALASNPHFFDAPPEIQQTILGLSPNAEKHSMGEFNIQPVRTFPFNRIFNELKF
jgi:hypothetical protein